MTAMELLTALWSALAPACPAPPDASACEIEAQALRARIRGLELAARVDEGQDCAAESALSCAACVGAVGAGFLLGGER